MVVVTGFDHVVLRVADVERSLTWYLEVLGLEPVRVDQWRKGTAPFPSVRISAVTIIDLISGPTVERGRNGQAAEPLPGANMDHLCLVIEPCDLDEQASSGRFTVVDGPGPRFGARGEGTSLYVLDPDANVVELRYYG